MSKYIDLMIDDDDLKQDADGLPLFVTDRDCIAQDIRHAIREKGYLVPLVAERSREKRQLWIQRIILLVEEDERIEPGTVTMEPGSDKPGEGLWNLLAETREFGAVTLNLSVGTAS